MGLARRMIPILNDVDRALSQVEDDDESPVAQGLRLLRNKLWRELEADGIKAIEAKGQEFNPGHHGSDYNASSFRTIPCRTSHRRSRTWLHV